MRKRRKVFLFSFLKKKKKTRLRPLLLFFRSLSATLQLPTANSDVLFRHHFAPDALHPLQALHLGFVLRSGAWTGLWGRYGGDCCRDVAPVLALEDAAEREGS